MLNIMLLDDDQNMKELLEFYLKNCGLRANIEHFMTPREACRAISKKEFDLWIVDHRLRGSLNGLTFVKELKKGTPLIYMSFYLTPSLISKVASVNGIALDKNELLKNPGKIKLAVEAARQRCPTCA